MLIEPSGRFLSRIVGVGWGVGCSGVGEEDGVVVVDDGLEKDFRKASSSASACSSREAPSLAVCCVPGRPKMRIRCSSVRLKSRFAFVGGSVVDDGPGSPSSSSLGADDHSQPIVFAVASVLDAKNSKQHPIRGPQACRVLRLISHE